MWVTPKLVIWSSVASRVDADSSSRGASKVDDLARRTRRRSRAAQRGQDQQEKVFVA